MNMLLIAAGGAAGSLLRYAAGKWLNSNFPTGTLLVNIAGGFIIGALWAVLAKDADEQKRLLLMTGFCGGFTTFSAFSLESVQLLQQSKVGLFSLYILLSVGGSLLATIAAIKIFN